MRFAAVFIILFSCSISGCSNPYEPHPHTITRIPSAPNTLLSFFTRDYLESYDGYFESVFFQHYDSSASRFESSADFINRLGSPYQPRQPFFVRLNDKELLDTEQYSLTYGSGDSVDFRQPLQWQISGGSDVGSFRDTLKPVEKVAIIFPTPNRRNILSRKGFSIVYDVKGADSVYIQFIFFGPDTNTLYFKEITFHAANTGSFDAGENLFAALLPRSRFDIALTAISSKIHSVEGQKYLIRTGTIDLSYGQFSD